MRSKRASRSETRDARRETRRVVEHAACALSPRASSSSGHELPFASSRISPATDRPPAFSLAGKALLAPATTSGLLIPPHFGLHLASREKTPKSSARRKTEDSPYPPQCQKERSAKRRVVDIHLPKDLRRSPPTCLDIKLDGQKEGQMGMVRRRRGHA